MHDKKTNFSSIILTIISCFLFLLPVVFQSQAEAITLTVENDSAPIGSQGNQIAITLDNDVPIKGVELKVCDEDNFISSTVCEGVDRAAGFICTLNENPDGCCRIMAFSVYGENIAPGSGSILNIEYDVSEEAPEGECRDLNQQNVLVVDEFRQTLAVTLESGGVCFTEACSFDTTTSSPTTTTTALNCSVDDDCNDGLFCNGVETCVDQLCQAGNDPCSYCDESTDECADTAVIISNGFAFPDTSVIKVPVCLSNPEVLVGGIQFDVCDSPDCLECITCELTERTVMFDCVTMELDNGCCRVIMFCKNPGCAINPGLCDIVRVVHNVNDGCSGECVTRTTENRALSDYNGFDLTSVGYSGEICFNYHIDEDEDGVDDDDDNCPTIPNGPNMGRCTTGTVECPCLSDSDCGTDGFCSMSQEDADNSGIGDICNDSMDNDGDEWEDAYDNCPTRANSTQEDRDGDGLGDLCDNCPDNSNIDQSDIESDGIGDMCDNCPENSNSDQADSDGDGIGDACDLCPSETIYGEQSAETQLLRSLRDNVLSQSHEGRELIKLYYQWSPSIVRAMEADEDFKEDVKDLVNEILPMIELTVE